jgi:hypothetical protein
MAALESNQRQDVSADDKRPPRAGFRLRVVFIVPFVGLLFVAIALIGWISLHNGQRSVEDLSRQLLSEINACILDHLDNFLQEPRRINAVNADALSRGMFDSKDQGWLQRHFIQQIRAFDSVSSVYFGNTAGGLADAGQEGAAGSLYVMGTEGFTAGHLYKRAVDSDGRPGQLLASVPSFDARTRPWYSQTTSRAGFSWTEPYMLSTGQDMAISACQPVRDATGHLLGVVSVDIFLSQLGTFMKTLPVGRSGHSFIMEPSGLLISSSGNEKMGSSLHLQERLSGSPVIRAAAEAITKQFGDLHSLATDRQLTMELEGTVQFVQLSPFGLLTVWIGSS